MDVEAMQHDDVNLRDRNKNGRLDPDEDPRRPIDERVEDLLTQMTLREEPVVLAVAGGGMHQESNVRCHSDNPLLPFGQALTYVNAGADGAHTLMTGSISAWYKQGRRAPRRAAQGQ